jgi:predicted O-methyltransferase YrrM
MFGILHMPHPIDKKSLDKMPEREILRFLRELDEYGQTHRMFHVSPEDGNFLRLMVLSANAKRVLEIGTAHGVSAIWMGLGLRKTDGTLLCIEVDSEKADLARTNIGKANLSHRIEVKNGDAFRVLPDLTGPFDLVFLDSWKEDYRRLFELFFPKVSFGGVILAHNVLTMSDRMDGFVDHVLTHPGLVTSVIAVSPEGFSVSYKKR